MEPEIVVPVAFFFFVIGLPVTLAIVSRYMAHQERMEYIRRGIMPPIPPDPRMMRKAMKFGAWPPGPPPQAPGTTFAPYYDPSFYAQHQLRRGIQVAFIGLALLIGLSFIGYHGGTYVYGPWLLGGLIPMFVGIAQIIGAVLSGATFGNAGVSVGMGAPQPMQGAAEPPPAAAGSVPPSGPYAGWRPGNLPEIEKPPSPPDYRG